MGGRVPQSDVAEGVYVPPRRRAQAWGVAVTTFMIVVCALMLNGRPIPGSEARVVALTALSLAREGNFDLDEYPDAPESHVRVDSGHRVPAIPLLASVLAAPFLSLARIAIPLDPLLADLVGKMLGAALVGAAAGLLAMAVALRYGEADAFRVALLFAVGTTIATNGLGLTRHAPGAFFLCVALYWIVRAEGAPRWAARAALPLSLALVADPLTVALVIVMTLGALVRWPRQILFFMCWGLPGATVFVITLLRTQPMITDAVCGRGHAALLLAPQGGLLLFSPVMLIAGYGVWRAFRGGERYWATILGAAVLAHVLLAGCSSDGLTGNGWGFLGMTAALPFLFFFLNDGLLGLPRLGWAVAALSLAIQLIGLFGGAQRQIERQSQDSARLFSWSLRDSPLAQWARERTLIFTIPFLHDGRVVLHEHRLVLAGKQGSRIAFGKNGPTLAGVEATMSHVQLLGAAKIKDERLELRRRGDGLFVRVPRAAHARELQLRISGNGQATLTVGERTFWTDAPRSLRYPVSSVFWIRRRYHYRESGGDEILIELESGRADIRTVILVSPSEPDEVFTL